MPGGVRGSGGDPAAYSIGKRCDFLSPIKKLPVQHTGGFFVMVMVVKAYSAGAYDVLNFIPSHALGSYRPLAVAC